MLASGAEWSNDMPLMPKLNVLQLGFIFVGISSIVLPSLIAEASGDAKKSTADLIELVRPEVVQVVVRIAREDIGKPIPAPLDQWFKDIPIVVEGTGFFVNDAGDIVTASHVVNGTQQIIQKLAESGIHADTLIGVSLPNVDKNGLTISSPTELFPVALVAVDPKHDIAVFHSTDNPFKSKSKMFSGPGTPQRTTKFAQLTTDRPRDGQEVFACGFPLNESGMVTTSGAIASAWKTKKLLTATTDTDFVEVFWADLRVNGGNSGGPVFRIYDQAVLGMAVELDGSLAIVVPAKYISAFLTDHSIKWNSAH